MTPTHSPTAGTQKAGSTTHRPTIANIDSTMQSATTINNGTTLTDDATVATSHVNPRVVRPMDNTEYVLKLNFSSKTSKSDNVLMQSFQSIMHSMQCSFADAIRIYDSRNTQVKQFNETSASKFVKSFPVNRKTFRTTNTPPVQAWFIFRIKLNKVKLQDLRQDQHVSAALQLHGARLSVHPWLETVTQVTRIGFFVGGPAPSYIQTAQFEDDVRKLLNPRGSKHYCPKFAVAYTTVAAKRGRKWERCTAFELQVESAQVSKMKSVLDKAFSKSRLNPDEIRFVYYSQRHLPDDDTFVKAINYQRQIASEQRVVAIRGLDPDHEFSFEVSLREAFPAIKKVLCTRASRAPNQNELPVGRYNLLCAKQDLYTLAHELHTKLQPLYQSWLSSEGLVPEDGAEVIRVVSNLSLSGDRSVGSNNTYDTRSTLVASCTSAFQDYELVDSDDEEETPKASVPPTIPLVITPPPIPRAGMGHPNSDSYAAAADINIRLRALEHERDSLRAEVQQLRQQQSPASTLTSTSSPSMDQIEQMLQRLTAGIKADLSAQFDSQFAAITATSTATPSPFRKQRKTTNEHSAEAAGNSSPMDEEQGEDSR